MRTGTSTKRANTNGTTPSDTLMDSAAGQRAAPAALPTTPSTGQVALAVPLAEAPWAVDEEEPHPTEVHVEPLRVERGVEREAGHLVVSGDPLDLVHKRGTTTLSGTRRGDVDRPQLRFLQQEGSDPNGFSVQLGNEADFAVGVQRQAPQILVGRRHGGKTPSQCPTLSPTPSGTRRTSLRPALEWSVGTSISRSCPFHRGLEALRQAGSAAAGRRPRTSPARPSAPGAPARRPSESPRPRSVPATVIVARGPCPRLGSRRGEAALHQTMGRGPRTMPRWQPPTHARTRGRG